MLKKHNKIYIHENVMHKYTRVFGVRSKKCINPSCMNIHLVVFQQSGYNGIHAIYSDTIKIQYLCV